MMPPPQKCQLHLPTPYVIIHGKRNSELIKTTDFKIGPELCKWAQLITSTMKSRDFFSLSLSMELGSRKGTLRDVRCKKEGNFCAISVLT